MKKGLVDRMKDKLMNRGTETQEAPADADVERDGSAEEKNEDVPPTSSAPVLTTRVAGSKPTISRPHCPNQACQSPTTNPADGGKWTCQRCGLTFSPVVVQTSAKVPPAHSVQTGLRCPNQVCRSRDLGVVKTVPGADAKKRFRVCNRCGLRFETTETAT